MLSLSDLPHFADKQPADQPLVVTGDMLNRWWYYSFELVPGVFTRSNLSAKYSPARHALAGVDVAGLRCLDLGTMEGLIPALWSKKGAKQVVATDCSPHCADKIAIVKRFHNVSFDHVLMPLQENAFDFLRRVQFAASKARPEFPQDGYREFDLVNLSGVLYHVWSPIHWLASCRPLVREGGLMVISTHFSQTEEPTMEFNVGGRLQHEMDTFWYISPSLFEYFLKLFALMPIAIYSHKWPTRIEGKESVYASIVCRAVEQPIIEPGDDWAALYLGGSWELNSYLRMKDYVKPGFVSYRAKPRGEEKPISIAEEIKKAPREIADDLSRFNGTLALNDFS